MGTAPDVIDGAEREGGAARDGGALKGTKIGVRRSGTIGVVFHVAGGARGGGGTEETRDHVQRAIGAGGNACGG